MKIKCNNFLCESDNVEKIGHKRKVKEKITNGWFHREVFQETKFKCLDCDNVFSYYGKCK